MKLNARRGQAPVEVKVCAGLLVGIPIIYFVLALVLLNAAGARPSVLLMPVTSLILGCLVVGGLALRMPSARFACYVIIVLFALLHAFGLLGAQLWWVQGFSLIAVAGYVYTAVLLSSRPVVRYVGGDAT